MSRIIKILGIIMVITTVLVASVAGTALAAGGNSDSGNKGEECPYRDGDCGDCIPNDYSYNWEYDYQSPGPHGNPDHGECVSANYSYKWNYKYQSAGPHGHRYGKVSN